MNNYILQNILQFFVLKKKLKFHRLNEKKYAYGFTIFLYHF